MRTCLGACLLALAMPALAQEAPAPADEPDRAWSLTLGGGVSLVSDDRNPWSHNIELARAFGDARLSLGYARSADNGQAGVPLSLASKSETLSAALGYDLGSVSLDLHGSYGQRRFDSRQFRRRNGQSVEIDGKGKSYGIGASVSVWVPLGENTSLTPYASLDHDSTETARALAVPRLGLVSVKDKEKGTTGSLGTALNRAFGGGGKHAIGVDAAWVVTSNSAARSGTFARRTGAVQGLRPQPGSGGSEDWFEIGGSASFALSDMVGLSLSASRTAGLAGPESSSLYTGLSFSF